MKCGKLITGGFSFCGVDIADLGLSYAPEKENTYVYRPTEGEVHEETFDGHDGSYFYGVSKKAKEFVLRCYFEEETIDHGIMERIYHLFRTGKSGKLIFSRRPWCYYYATVTSVPHPELSNYMNGLITITMKASYPYARSDFMYSQPYYNDNILYNETIDNSMYHELIMESTAMVDRACMVPKTTFTEPELNKTFILHNPGTEYAPVSIMISGDAGMGVTIRNSTTKQECKIIAMDAAHTSDVSKAIYVDGLNGNTSVVSVDNTTSPTPGFVYHDSGFISLVPAYPCIRNVFINRVVGTTVDLASRIYDDVVGKYIYLGEWVKILDADEQSLKIPKFSYGDYSKPTIITEMNELEIIPVDTASIDYISFIYKPTFA